MRKILGYIGFIIISCIAALYTAAWIFAPEQDIQLTHMLDIPNADFVAFYDHTYTLLLLMTVVAGFLHLKNHPYGRLGLKITVPAVLTMTALPLGYAIFYHFDPARYENYLGEIFTLAGLVLLLFGATSARVAVVARERKKALLPGQVKYDSQCGPKAQ